MQEPGSILGVVSKSRSALLNFRHGLTNNFSHLQSDESSDLLFVLSESLAHVIEESRAFLRTDVSPIPERFPSFFDDMVDLLSRR